MGLDNAFSLSNSAHKGRYSYSYFVMVREVNNKKRGKKREVTVLVRNANGFREGDVDQKIIAPMRVVFFLEKK